MVSGYVVGNIVRVLVGFPMVEKNSGPFAEYLRQAVSKAYHFSTYCLLGLPKR
jgi:hypothetical protein